MQEITRWAWALNKTQGHHLARRVRLTNVETGTKVTRDHCACGASESGIGDTEPVRSHFVAVLGHAVEYARIGPETTETGADAVTVGCVCGWTAGMLDDLESAHALHDVHATYPETLAPVTTAVAY